MRYDFNQVPMPVCKHAHFSATEGLTCGMGFNPYWLAEGVRPFTLEHVPCYSFSKAFCAKREPGGES